MDNKIDNKIDNKNDNKTDNSIKDQSFGLACNNCGRSHDRINKNNNKMDYKLVSTTKCPGCCVKFPSCSVCQLPIKLKCKVTNDEFNQNIWNYEEGGNDNTCFVICSKCEHGGHFNHIIEWFKEFKRCPMANCNCECCKDNETKKFIESYKFS